MTEAVDHQLQVLHSEIFKSPLFSSYACYLVSMVHGLSKTWNSVKGLESFRCTENSARDIDISFCNSLVSKLPCFINDWSFLCSVVFKSIWHTHCHHCGDIYIFLNFFNSYRNWLSERVEVSMHEQFISLSTKLDQPFNMFLNLYLSNSTFPFNYCSVSLLHRLQIIYTAYLYFITSPSSSLTSSSFSPTQAPLKAPE